MENQENNPIENLGKEISKKQAEIKNQLDSKASSEELTNLKAELKGLKDELEAKNTEMLNAAKIQGEEIANLKESKSKSMSIKSQVDKISKEVFSETKGRDLPNGKMIKKDIDYSTIVNEELHAYDAGFQSVAGFIPTIESIFPHIKIGDNNGSHVRYWDVTSWDPNAAFVDPCAPGATPDMALDILTEPIKSVKAYLPFCEAAVEDHTVLAAEMRKLLFDSIKLQVATQIISGDGIGSNMKGLDFYAQAFAAGDFALKFSGATIAELVLAIQQQMVINSNGRLTGTHVIMNPVEATCLLAARDANGNQVRLNYLSDNGQMVAGLKVVSDPKVAVGSLYVVDASKVTIYARESASLESGHIDQQFIEDKMTMKMSRRLALIQKLQDTGAIVKVADVDAAILAVTKP